MRIVAMSDSHGDGNAVRQVVETHLGDADLFLHLGDGAAEFCAVMEEYPRKAAAYVVGNNESVFFQWNHRKSMTIDAGGHTIFLTHGDRLHVKLDLLELLYMGKRSGTDVILFGHTHRALDEETDGIRLINPGALRYPRGGGPSYAVLDLAENKIAVQFCSVGENRPR